MWDQAMLERCRLFALDRARIARKAIGDESVNGIVQEALRCLGGPLTLYARNVYKPGQTVEELKADLAVMLAAELPQATTRAPIAPEPKRGRASK
jgi:hypothetical protein